jgi:hypothetical protein
LSVQHRRLILGGVDVERHHDEIRPDTEAEAPSHPHAQRVLRQLDRRRVVPLAWPHSHPHAVWPETEAAFVSEVDVQFLARPLSLVHLRQPAQTELDQLLNLNS